MQTLKMIEPFGLNIAGSVYSAHTLLRLLADYYVRSVIIFNYFHSFLFS